MNHDLGVGLYEIDTELRRRVELLDQAMAIFDQSGRELAASYERLREAFARSIGQHYDRGKTASVAKALAEGECRHLLREVEEVSSMRDSARANIEVLQNQITAAQTRARLWIAQWNAERGSG